MKAKHQKIKSIFLILILFLITTSPILLSALQKNFAIRVACVGDSITYGAKIEDNFLNSYPAQLQLFLGSDYLVGNFGASGYTLQKSGNFPYWNHPAFQESSAFQPNIVLIMLGTNDTKPYNWTGTENFLADYRELIAHYRSSRTSSLPGWTMPRPSGAPARQRPGAGPDPTRDDRRDLSGRSGGIR